MLPSHLCPHPTPYALTVSVLSIPTHSQASWIGSCYFLSCECLPHLTLTFRDTFLAVRFFSFSYYNQNSPAMLPQMTLVNHVQSQVGAYYSDFTNVTQTSICIFVKLVLAFVTTKPLNQWHSARIVLFFFTYNSPIQMLASSSHPGNQDDGSCIIVSMWIPLCQPPADWINEVPCLKRFLWVKAGSGVHHFSPTFHWIVFSHMNTPSCKETEKWVPR